MAGFDTGIKVFFGGDTSQLRSSLNEANSMVDGFTKAVKKAGVDLGKGFGFGLLIYQAKQFFADVINHAQETRDAFEEMGRPIPASIASVARLGDEMDRLKKGALEAGAAVLGFVTKSGEGWGMLINRIRGISREQEKMAEKIERDTEKQEKARDEAFKNREAKERERANRKAREDAAAKRDADAAAKAREKQLDDEYEDLVRIGKAQSDLDDAKKKAAYEQLSLSSKIRADEKESVALAKQIADYKKNGALTANDQLRVIELENKQLEVNTRLAENRKDLAEQTAKAEKQITKELEAQTAFGSPFATSDIFSEASDETLAEVIAREQADLARNSPAMGQFSNISNDISNAQRQQRLAAALREREFRDRIRQDAALGGKEAARRNFQGDPLMFDRVFDQLVKGQTVNEKIAMNLEDIRKQFKQGVPMVFSGNNS